MLAYKCELDLSYLSYTNMNMSRRLFYFSSLSILLVLAILLKQMPVMSFPLYTNSRWIVDENMHRVKLACANWPSHLQVMVAEGLSKQPVDVIAKKIVSMGFNCVRLTWPIYLVTNDSLSSLSVRQSFQNLGLVESIAGLVANNPSIVDLPLIKAYQAVVSSLGNNNVMVILDNHISKPGWCCGESDGNGFFGDEYFDPGLWLEGLTRMATIFNNVTNVVGMSLRNELRGARQNVGDWYRYMQQGAEAVHSANSNVLVILSGLNYDTDLSFLLKQPVNVTFTEKLVFEMHWYSWSDGNAWGTGNANQVCGEVVGNLTTRGLFLLDQGWPLFMSEFGADERGTNLNDNKYVNCLISVAAEYDLDWALWALQGSYYLREGVMGMEEFYGVLSWNWCATRNSSYLQKISALQSAFQGPGSSGTNPHKIIFHPSTGLCVMTSSPRGDLKLGPCAEADSWSYTPEQTLTLEGTHFCIRTIWLGQPARLGIFCRDPSSKWETISDSKMHLSSKLPNGNTICLDIGPNNTIVTNTCQCLSTDNMCDPASQWFKIVNSTRSSTTPKPLITRSAVNPLFSDQLNPGQNY